MSKNPLVPLFISGVFVTYMYNEHGYVPVWSIITSVLFYCLYAAVVTASQTPKVDSKK